ncbi:MAG: hypothetical protein JXA41_16130 [Deltaproteobacteria bacterium]|nr:hypothetical protein [Deltaproteobacteria bacterium]
MILEQARKKLQDITGKYHIDDQEVTITCKTLTPEEAIGNPLHDDYPIQLGKERLIEANFMGKKGQAFSDSYFNYKGSVNDILSIKLDRNAKRAIFVSSLNAILAGLDWMPEAIHCKDDDLMRCGDDFMRYIQTLPPEMDNVLLVGLQPRLLETLKVKKQVRVCDLNPDNIGTVKYGVMIDGPERFHENARWAKAVYATGSTVVNGTIDDILSANPSTCFYGVTITGVARLMGLHQFCYIIRANQSPYAVLG